jgi:transposase
MTRGHELTDGQWERLKPLLAAEKPRTGRPNQEHRMMLNGMLWRAKTGRSWRDLPERYGKWKTVYSRWLRWRDGGVWQRVGEALQQEANQKGNVGWDMHFIDRAIVRAHQQAAGAKKAGRQPRA